MSSERPQQTLADYVVIAINPVLIMALVGSLVFFLLEMFYAGEHVVRLRWVMMWFVMATVLIARISMIEGVELASMYGAALALATGVVLWRFVDHVWIAWLLMGLAWWCAHRLTWDSTHVADSEEGSGAGLLEAAGLDRPETDDRHAADLQHRRPASVRTQPDDHLTIAEADAGRTWWQRLFLRPPRGRPHAPGVWVVYFSLAALPAFGLGQLFVGAGDPSRRSYVFGLLCIYLASAIGLLLTTSFLGLRRYLRQRRLEMPPAMTGAWLSVGAVLGLALLIFAAVLPLPGERSILSWRPTAPEDDRGQASRFAMIRESPAEGPGRPAASDQPSGDQGDETAAGAAGPGEARDGQPAAATGDRGQPGGDGSGEADSAGGQAAGEQGTAGQTGDQAGASQTGNDSRAASDQSDPSTAGDASQGQSTGRQRGESGDAAPDRGEAESGSGPSSAPAQGMQQHAESSPRESTETPRQPDRSTQDAASPPSGPRAPSMLLSEPLRLAKWILWAVLAIVGIYLAIRHRDAVAAGLKRLLASWRDLWASLFGRRGATDEQGESKQSTPPRRPFASFGDPFVEHVPGCSTPEGVVRYSFLALDAWAAEHGHPRASEQTPLEFCQSLGRAFPQMAKELAALSTLYGQVVYARGQVSRESLAPLARLWRRWKAMPGRARAAEVGAAG